MNAMSLLLNERPWGLSNRIGQLQDEFNRACGMYLGRTAPVFPPVNLWLKDDEMLVEAEVPGVELKDIELAVTGDSLTISGERKKDGLKDEDVYHRCERRAGAFSRAIELPFRVQQDKVSASCKNGVLRVILPRSEEDKPRKVKVIAE